MNEQRADAPWQDVRAQEFPTLGPDLYFNAASYGLLPRRVARWQAEYNERRAAGRLRAPDDFGDTLHLCRSAAARLVGAGPDEIALTPNTSVGVNIAAAMVRARTDARRTMLVPAGEFPANVYPWRELERDGFRLELMPLNARGWPDEPALHQRLERGDVAVLAISAVQFATGYRADLVALGRTCTAHDTFFFVDAIQALGAAPLDVRAAAIDVLACGGQKWLCAPFGTGFTFVQRERLAAARPDLPGWLAFTASYDHARLTTYDDTLLPDARRFEVGTIAPHDHGGLAVAIDLILELGVDRIVDRLRQLQQPLIDWALRHGVELATPGESERRAGIICLRLSLPEPALRHLTEQGVTCALREDLLRFSPHYYNTETEMHRLLELLEPCLND